MSIQSNDIQRILKTEIPDVGLVSVVMPMHNASRFVGAAIESVLAQTYQNWELLVVEDCSTDNSVEIAQKYASENPKIQVLFNDNPIRMPSAPRNMGIRAAKGRFIAFLDSDDLWFPQKLEQQLAFFGDNRTAIVFSTAPSKATYGSLLHGNVIGNLTGIYDTKKTGKVIVKDIHHEDYVMWLHILKEGYIARNTGTTLAAYRVCTESVSSNKLKVASWQWNIYRQVERFSFIRSAYYMVSYAYKAFAKSII